MDSIVDVYVCNDLKLIIDFIEKQTNIEGSTANEVFPGHGII